MKDCITFDENENEIEAYPNDIGFNVPGTTKEEQ